MNQPTRIKYRKFLIRKILIKHRQGVGASQNINADYTNIVADLANITKPILTPIPYLIVRLNFAQNMIPPTVLRHRSRNL